MNYCVEVRADKEVDTDISMDFVMLDVITNFECPETLSSEVVFNEDKDTELYSKFNVVPEVIDTETITEGNQTYDVDIMNKQAAIDSVILPGAAWVEVSCHCCSHDEAINRPCSPKTIETVIGDVPSQEEVI